NMTVMNSDICFRDSPMVENQRIGNDSIYGALATRALRLTHPVTDHFPASKLHLFAVHREILLHLDDEIGVRKTQLIADCRTKHLRIGCAADAVWHSRLPQ